MSGREVVQPWQRHPVPAQVCKCGHGRAVHHIAGREPCSIHPCGCLAFRLDYLAYTEQRIVRAYPLDSPDATP